MPQRTETWLEQFRMLENLPHKVEGGDNLMGDFDSVVFFKNGDNMDAIKVIFEDYILSPPPQFDLHERWNHGIAPYAKVMFGRVIAETNGMYHFVLHTEYNDKVWDGWCPKKSCAVEAM